MGSSASASTTTVIQSNLSSSDTTNLISSMDSDNDNDNINNNDKSKSTLRHLLEFDMEGLEHSRWWRAGAAGSIAGLTEHTLLYPIDTVKTRMQAVLISNIGTQYKSFIDCFTQVCIVCILHCLYSVRAFKHFYPSSQCRIFWKTCTIILFQ